MCPRGSPVLFRRGHSTGSACVWPAAQPPMLCNGLQDHHLLGFMHVSSNPFASPPTSIMCAHTSHLGHSSLQACRRFQIVDLADHMLAYGTSQCGALSDVNTTTPFVFALPLSLPPPNPSPLLSRQLAYTSFQFTSAASVPAAILIRIIAYTNTNHSTGIQQPFHHVVGSDSA